MIAHRESGPATGSVRCRGTSDASTLGFSVTACPLLILLLALAGCTSATGVPAASSDSPMTLYDFSTDTDAGWFIVNDGVMGGHSDGHVAHEDGALVFSGDLVTRDGGFTAARTDKTADLSDTAAVELVVRGDGRTYEFELSDGTMRRGEMVSRKAPFETTAGEQQTVRVAFADLDATVFGEAVSVPPFDPSSLVGIGIFMADGQDGPFHLEVLSVTAVN